MQSRERVDIGIHIFVLLLLGGGAVSNAFGQVDPVRKTGTFTFEERTRWEEKFGVDFGEDVNQQHM